jgi:DNA end-binding protein Ku
MAPRANWKGTLKIAELSCRVALFTAASAASRLAFHTVNRETGHRVQRIFVDQETGEPVAHDDQAKGYELSHGEYVMLEPDEIIAAIPETDKTLAVEQFLECGDIDTTYFDKPYYLAPADAVSSTSFALIRDGMRQRHVAALARTVLFRRLRTVLIRPHDAGLIAHTLHFDYEVRSAADAFSGIPKLKIQGEMLDLAKHIIKTKSGSFDAAAFDDRYESALAELVRAKVEGRPIVAPKRANADKVVDLMEALRQSAGATSPRRAPRKTAAPRRKAG